MIINDFKKYSKLKQFLNKNIIKLFFITSI